MRKGEQTRQEPIFSQNGYEGAVLSDLMAVTVVRSQALWRQTNRSTVGLKMNFPRPVWQARLRAEDRFMGNLRVWIFSTLMRLRPSHKLKQPVIHYRGHRHMSLR